MKKSVVGIFAHPDDEAFGPAGSLVLLSKTHDVYLICATNGDAGQNHSSNKNSLDIIRKEELIKSSKLLGIKQVFFLDFKDGELNQTLYHLLAEKIQEIINKLKPELLITYEPRGVSGHIDHIVVSMVSTFVFERFSFIKKLYYYCISDFQRKMIRNYFIYFPPGYKKEDINLIIDISSVWDIKIRAIQVHASQAKDGRLFILGTQALSKIKWWSKIEEYFLVRNK